MSSPIDVFGAGKGGRKGIRYSVEDKSKENFGM
jgi:hypothetical protein